MSLVETTTIHFGNQNNFLLHGVVGILVSLVAAFASPILALLIFTGSICILCVHSGIEFDANNKRARNYFQLFRQRRGTWIDLASVKMCRLDYHNETSNVVMPITVPVPHSSLTAKTYDLKFIMDSNEVVEFHEFIDYKPALEACGIIRNKFGLAVLNEFEERQKTAQSRPKRR